MNLSLIISITAKSIDFWEITETINYVFVIRNPFSLIFIYQDIYY